MSDHSLSDIGLAAALARRYAEDEQEFLETLAVFMATALPEITKVERAGPFWARQRPISRIALTMSDARYLLESEPTGIKAKIVRIRQGIASRTECPSVAQWLESLTAALNTRLGQSRAAREALEKLLG